MLETAWTDCYKPSETEAYMSRRQLLYFREKLENRRRELQRKARHTRDNLREERPREADFADRVSREEENLLDLREQQHVLATIEQINAALRRIDAGEYGYCSLTGEEIGIQRLLAYPTAQLCVEAQELRERFNRQYSTRD